MRSVRWGDVGSLVLAIAIPCGFAGVLLLSNLGWVERVKTGGSPAPDAAIAPTEQRIETPRQAQDPFAYSGAAAGLSTAPQAKDDRISVYRCGESPSVTYSDVPCGPDAELQEIDPAHINTYSAPAIPQTGSSSGSAPYIPRSNSGESPVEHPDKAACDWVRGELDRLNTRMRAGYGNREGERLRERYRQLKDQQYKLGCRFR